MELTDQQKAEISSAVVGIMKHLRVTKVVCSRSVKGPNGDSYLGFSAAWDSVQDDAGGADLAAPEEGSSKGLSLKESRLAAIILAMQTDLAAHNHAFAGGNLSEAELQRVVSGIKAGYNRLIVETMFGDGTENG